MFIFMIRRRTKNKNKRGYTPLLSVRKEGKKLNISEYTLIYMLDSATRKIFYIITKQNQIYKLSFLNTEIRVRDMNLTV